MESSRRPHTYFIILVVVVTMCFILITLLSGYSYEYKKFRQYMFSFITITILRYIIFEHIVIPIYVLIKTLIAMKMKAKRLKVKSDRYLIETNYRDLDSPMDFLKLRLESLKAQMYLSTYHKDENLNLKYQLLTQEIWLFGKYFVLVILLIANSLNSYAYYNTANMRTIFNESYFTNYSLKSINTVYHIYRWANDTLTEALNGGQTYNGSAIAEPGWVHFHMAKLLGVVRFQQIRFANKTYGMLKLDFDENDYLPKWKPLERQLHYVDKYWRTYYPWLSKKYDGITNWLMSISHIGSLFSYSENNGYVAVLARDKKNSEKIITFLEENDWFDENTSAVIIDFTLYNTDANLFTMCSILVEQTPFGDLIWHISVQSAELLTNFNEFTIWLWVLYLVYILQLIQLSRVLIIKAWFMPDLFKSRWNCIDLAIIILNLLFFVLKFVREHYVGYVLKSFAESQKLDYVDFRVASLFDYMATIAMGFLVCLVTLRIWKILQFSSIFRIFNRTLYTSAGALFATVIGIHVLLFAISLAAQIVNGSYTEIFSRYLKSVTAIMSFSFGFNSRTSPDDLSHGGNTLGFILYLILMFFVAIFMINMFITLICGHFASAREERENQPPHQLTYWQYLKIELAFIANFYRKLFPRYYKPRKQTVSENIDKKLNDLEKTSLYSEETVLSDQTAEEKVQHIKNISAVLQLQIEILERRISLQDLERDSENITDKKSKR